MALCQNVTLEMIKKDTIQKWNGWGFKDSGFVKTDETNSEFTGDRYFLCRQQLPVLVGNLTSLGKLDFSQKTPSKETVENIPQAVINKQFLNWLVDKNWSYSMEGMHRVNRSHGHSAEDVVELRMGKCKSRIPDIVVWPANHQDVVEIVKTANETNVSLIPFGGGTSVTNALSCPEDENRCIVSLDLCRMNKILWINQDNMLARAEAGIVGIDLEKMLNEKGLTIGHEPDSIEFSTLGGWVATRASGIKKNKYGNIDDIIVHVTMVTGTGVVNKSCTVPRLSAGPDIHQFILGSEGTLGVITEVTFKICTIAPKKYGAVIFSSFEVGVQFLHELTRIKIIPASVRLYDSKQFATSRAVKPNSWRMHAVNILLKVLHTLKGFHPDEISPVSVVFEGSKQDFGLDYSSVSESFETSVTWDKINSCIKSVRNAVENVKKNISILEAITVSVRVTQVYDAGVCLYFYVFFTYKNKMNGLSSEEILELALQAIVDLNVVTREAILLSSGSISHHHGVGKMRQQWLPEVVGNNGISALKAIKSTWDPKNIFGVGNLYANSKL